MKAASEEVSESEKCIKQLALTVVKNVKFHSSLQRAGRFIVENAMRKEEGNIKKY